jgi:hypothetical protein
VTQPQLFDASPPHDPGGKVRIPVPASWQCDAVFSPCQRYRYQLSRTWQNFDYPHVVAFILMNPSTADVRVNDPTVAKCCRFAQRWGYDGVLIGNVCAYRSTDKRTLPMDGSAIGDENPEYLLRIAKRANKIVMAYGQLPPPLRPVGEGTVCYLRLMNFDLHVLKLGKNDVPMHPLYLKEDLQPVEWKA